MTRTAADASRTAADASRTAADAAGPSDASRTAAPRPAERLSAADAAARLTWMVLDGPSVDRDADELLRRGIGGVVLFGRNVESPEQVRRLTADLRRRATAPLRIAIDQEGGHVVRVGAPLTRFPSAMAIGATRSPALAHAVAMASARELAWLGVDVALAPVLDVAVDPRNPTIGSRSFGSSPALVALLAAASIRGYLDGGVIPTPKHFPGHGRTPLDSHLERPIVRGGIRTLAALDLVPFQAAFAAQSPIVMVSHVAYEELTHGLPATLSPFVLRTLLRERLGFDGVALTDAMVMDAVADGRSVPEACVAALMAGADVVMPLEPQRRAVAETERALRSGRLGEAGVAASLRRLADLDARATAIRARARRAGGLGPAGTSAVLDVPGAGSHEALARAVARQALTLVHGRWQGPISPAESVLVVEFGARVASPIEDGSAPSGSLARALGDRLPRATSIVVTPGPDRRLAEARAIGLARSVDLVVVATRDGALDRDARLLVGAITATNRPIVHVALRNPADLAVFPSAIGIATYSDVPASLLAVAAALTDASGDAAARFPGRLPMRLEPPDARTAGSLPPLVAALDG